MIKLICMVALCGMLIDAQTLVPLTSNNRLIRQAPPNPPPPPAPQANVHHSRLVRQAPPNPPPAPAPPMNVQNRLVRQAPPGSDAAIPEGARGGMNPGNLAMQGMGNIPDPTVWIAKGQEMASQFARGRRRRQSIPQVPQMPKMPRPVD